MRSLLHKSTRSLALNVAEFVRMRHRVGKMPNSHEFGYTLFCRPDIPVRPSTREATVARIVCQVLHRAERITFLWSEGAASFEPYHLEGAERANLLHVAEQIHAKLSQ